MGYSVIRLWRPGSMPRYAVGVYCERTCWAADAPAPLVSRSSGVVLRPSRLTTLATDGLSGLIVMATMLGSRWAWKTVFRRASLPRAA